jgi:hypothetical protein
METHFTLGWSCFFCILKIKSVKILSSFKIILNSHNLEKENFPYFGTWFKHLAKIQKRCLKKILLLDFSFEPNLAKSSYGSSPLYLHHKIDPPKKKKKKKKHLKK